MLKFPRQWGRAYYSCCVARQKENCRRNFHKNILQTLAIVGPCTIIVGYYVETSCPIRTHQPYISLTSYFKVFLNSIIYFTYLNGGWPWVGGDLALDLDVLALLDLPLGRQGRDRRVQHVQVQLGLVHLAQAVVGGAHVAPGVLVMMIIN